MTDGTEVGILGKSVDPGLLPDFATWLSVNPGHGISTYVSPELKPEHFFAVAALLSPAIIVYHGGIFLRDDFDTSRFRGFFYQTKGNLTAVEKVMNHQHIRNVAKSLADAPFALVQAVGEVVKFSLEAWLRYVLPDQKIIVDLQCGTDDVEVTFFCRRDDICS